MQGYSDVEADVESVWLQLQPDRDQRSLPVCMRGRGRRREEMVVVVVRGKRGRYCSTRRGETRGENKQVITKKRDPP